MKALLRECKPGWSLPGPFYHDEELYHLDLERIWRQSWLFAGHSCEIPDPGDYFTLEAASEPLVVLRTEAGEILAFYNLCRHRGSLVCTDAQGQAKRLVCPYHQWTYGLDGKLLACRGMPEDFEKSQFGLKRVHAREVEGLIYVSLAEAPPAFDPAHEALAPFLQPQGFPRAKVAKLIDYEVRANWKLVWENNRECYHCNVNHPQYIKANFDHYNADDTTHQIRKRMDESLQRSQAKWASAGLAPTHTQTGMAQFPDVERGIWYSANRTALVEGYLSETMDGTPVAPLMGGYTSPDVGTLRVRTLPNFWNHSSCDHAVSTRLLPGGPELTHVRVLWLVREDAMEGKDYQLKDLLPFWQLTSEQDWEICERQQRGIKSKAYEPGPYSPYKEYNVDGFVRWYLKQLS